MYKRHALVCRHLQADDTLVVYVSPFHLMDVVVALRVDLDGGGSLRGEAAHVLLSMLKIMRIPLLK